MKAPLIFLAVLATVTLLTLGGCKHVSGSGMFATKSGSVSVSTTQSKSSGARHCPPGQAKKGRC
jgi:hypothetical protein